MRPLKKEDYSTCLLQIVALSTVSVLRIPFSPREVIPYASFLREFTNEQNFFIFLRAVGISVFRFEGEGIENVFPLYMQF